MLFALFAAIFEFIYIVGTKKFLSLKKHLNYKTFILILFFFLFMGSLMVLPFYSRISADFLSLKYILVFVAMIVVAVIWNVLYYQGLHKEKLVEFELVTMVYPLATIFFASIFLPYEFSTQVFIAGVVASLALIFSHISKSHLRFNKVEKKLLWTVILMAIESILISCMLEVMSSVSLYCVRTGMIFIAFLIMYRKDFRHIKIDIYFLYQALLAFVGVALMIFKFESYAVIGVSFTTLIALLTPILTFLWAHFKEKESFPLKKIIAALVIICAILYAYLTG